jgi:hypothetical protein
MGYLATGVIVAVAILILIAVVYVQHELRQMRAPAFIPSAFVRKVRRPRRVAAGGDCVCGGTIGRTGRISARSASSSAARAAVGGRICHAGRTGCPGRHQPGPHRQRCRRKAGAGWRPSWAPAAAVPGTTVAGIGSTGTARSCAAGFAGRVPAWQRPGKEEL